MFIIRSRGLRKLFPISGLRSPFQCSTSADSAPTSQTHFMVDYLINSVGLSREEAISALPKVSHLKSTENSDLVLHVFKQFGLDKTQIRSIVSSVPQILLHKGDKTLEPKMRAFRDLGLSRSDLVKLIKNSSTVLERGLESHIIPTIDYLREIMGSNEKVVEVIYKSKWLLSSNPRKIIPANVLLLQNYGLSNEKIRSFIIKNTMYVLRKPEWLEDKLHWVEGELRIPRNSPMFFYGIYALASVSNSTVEKKFGVFRSFGWSDSDVFTLARNQPLCLTLSEAKIQNGLNFFMKELGYAPAYLVSNPNLLTYSLEKRVKPRNEVLKILKEKKLVKSKPSLCSLASYPELRFMKFMLRHENEIPNLCEIYTTSIMKTSKYK